MKFVDLEFENKEAVAASVFHFSNIQESGKYLLGPYLEKFETEFAADQRYKAAVGVKNATDALYMCFKLLQSEKRAIVLPQFGAYPTVMAAIQSGAKKIIAAPVDENLTITLDDLKIPKNSIIVAVNLFGNECKMQNIYDVAKITDSLVIEDCAQSTGLPKNEKTFAAVHSFYPTKPLGCRGDGGAILSDDTSFIEKCKQSRFYGLNQEGSITSWGFNSRMDEWQSALLLSKINFYKSLNESRRKNAKKYNDALGFSCVNYTKNSVYHQYVTLWKNRNSIQKKLEDAGVPTIIHYPKLLCDMPFLTQHVKFKNCKRICDHVLSLPVGPHLNEIDVENISEFLRKNKNETIDFKDIA